VINLNKKIIDFNFQIKYFLKNNFKKWIKEVVFIKELNMILSYFLKKNKKKNIST